MTLFNLSYKKQILNDKHRLFFSLCLFLLVSRSFAQTQNIDSLLFIVNQNKPDTNYIKAAVEIGVQYRLSKTDSAFYYASKAINLSEELNYKRGKRNGMNVLGQTLHNKGQYKEAVAVLDELYSIAVKDKDTSSMAASLNNAASGYLRLGNYTTALEKYLMSATLHEHMGNFGNLTGVYRNISSIYRRNLKQYDKALYYANQALKFSKRDNTPLITGNAYEAIASSMRELNQIDSSLYYGKLALENYQKAQSTIFIISQNVNVGEIFLFKNKPDSAIKYLESAYKISENSKFKSWEARAKFYYAEAQTKLNPKQDQSEIINKGILLAKEINEPFRLTEGYRSMHNILMQQGKYQTALLYRDSVDMIEDSLNTIETTNKLNELSVQYETAKKENEIEKLSSDKKIQQLQLDKQRAEIAGNIAAQNKSSRKLIY